MCESHFLLNGQEAEITSSATVRLLGGVAIEQSNYSEQALEAVPAELNIEPGNYPVES